MRRISCETLDCPANVAILEDHCGLVIRILTDLTVKNAVRVRDAVLSAWAEQGQPGRIVLDLSGVRHLDSSGVGTLMDLARRAGVAGIPCVLCILQGGPRRLLERTGIIGLFDVSAAAGAAHPFWNALM